MEKAGAALSVDGYAAGGRLVRAGRLRAGGRGLAHRKYSRGRGPGVVYGQYQMHPVYPLCGSVNRCFGFRSSVRIIRRGRGFGFRSTYHRQNHSPGAGRGRVGPRPGRRAGGRVPARSRGPAEELALRAAREGRHVGSRPQSRPGAGLPAPGLGGWSAGTRSRSRAGRTLELERGGNLERPPAAGKPARRAAREGLQADSRPRADSERGSRGPAGSWRRGRRGRTGRGRRLSAAGGPGAGSRARRRRGGRGRRGGRNRIAARRPGPGLREGRARVSRELTRGDGARAPWPGGRRPFSG